MKSAAAFEFTAGKMLRETTRLYFWTFTFRDVHSTKEAMQRWNEFLTRLKKKFGFRGVRVIELHEEHGIHFHVLTNRRFKIRPFLEIGELYGFGRTGVKAVKDVLGGVRYLCKYLNKPREGCLKGARLWAAFGDVPRTRVADIVNDSTFGRLLRHAMGSRSPDEELAGVELPKKQRGSKERRVSFLKALEVAQREYAKSFDPKHEQRQSIWQQLRFHRQCQQSMPWLDAAATKIPEG